MGAPLKNRNRLVHGLRAYFATGRLPKGASYVTRLVNGMRNELESAVMAQHGSIGVHHAGLIQSAARHEVRALLLLRWLREADELDVMDRAKLLDRVSGATDSRDRCIEKLGIDRIDEFETLYRPVNEPNGRDDGQHDSADDASDAD